ncbi:hypothetical protein Tco_0272396 [Tanacetum coccineum]
MESLNSIITIEREMHQLQQMQDKAKEKMHESFCLLHFTSTVNHSIKSDVVKRGKDDSSTTLDAGLVVTESNETESERHVSSSRSGKDTHAEDAEINSVNDKQPLAEVQNDCSYIEELFAMNNNIMCNLNPFMTHICWKRGYRNTIPDSTNNGFIVERKIEQEC